MVLGVWRHLKSMPILQWVALWAIGLLPVLLLPNIPSSLTFGPFDLPEFLRFSKTVGPYHLPFLKNISLAAWTIFVLVVVPKAFREEKFNSEQIVDKKLEGPIRDIQQQKEDWKRAVAGLEAQIERLDRDMRSGFQEVGVDLPSRQASIAASISGSGGSVSASLTKVPARGPRWMIRVRLWVTSRVLPILKRVWMWFWKRVWG